MCGLNDNLEDEARKDTCNDGDSLSKLLQLGLTSTLVLTQVIERVDLTVTIKNAPTAISRALRKLKLTMSTYRYPMALQCLICLITIMRLTVKHMTPRIPRIISKRRLSNLLNSSFCVS